VGPEVKNPSHECLDWTDKVVPCRSLTNNFAHRHHSSDQCTSVTRIKLGLQEMSVG
jgi:hypothetical protein